MSRKHSFVITLSNNKTEKEGVLYLLENHTGFYETTKESKKEILALLNIEKRYTRSFDLIYIPNLDVEKLDSSHLKIHLEDIILVELKTTKEYLPENPKGFFFGATENEFNFGKILGDKFRFCFVCLNENSKSYKLLTLGELNSIIRNKRIQYQINL